MEDPGKACLPTVIQEKCRDQKELGGGLETSPHQKCYLSSWTEELHSWPKRPGLHSKPCP